ncbi:hypothetical protein F4780DRAFT_791994 [Xylariomycetidae sp. FL0641]|nr:hypothetical protein F4780DRAFT_791994 [Xylariomycetidae sp. FL0641]
MAPSMPFVLSFLTAAARLATANDIHPFKFCTDDQCGDCPVSITSAGTGYPNCVIYNTADVFANYGFNGSEGGGWQPYIDITEPDNEHCGVVIRSPAETTLEGCGYPILATNHDACAAGTLEETFMVQFCCGMDDCQNVGLPGKRSSVLGNRGTGAGPLGLTLKGPDGTPIAPAKVGPPPEKRRAEEAEKKRRAEEEEKKQQQQQKRGTKCDKDSWVADAGMESYTRPSDNTTIVLASVSEGDNQITHTRSQSYTTTLEAGLGIEDILSLGISFSITETIEDSSARTFHVDAGQSGSVGFTAYLRCSTGKATCGDDGELHGEVCTPYNLNGGDLAGKYALIINS